MFSFLPFPRPAPEKNFAKRGLEAAAVLIFPSPGSRASSCGCESDGGVGCIAAVDSFDVGSFDVEDGMATMFSRLAISKEFSISVAFLSSDIGRES